MLADEMAMTALTRVVLSFVVVSVLVVVLRNSVAVFVRQVLPCVPYLRGLLN